MRHIAVVFFSILLVSCSGSKMLQSSLIKLNSSIGYLHDSPKTNCQRNNQVYFIINHNPLDSITTVSKINNLVLPLIIFNHFETTMKVKLGQSSIQESYNTFFASSLADESKRSGCFNVSNALSNDSIHTLELTIDTCSTTSKYRKSTTFYFLVFAYGWNISESGSPAETRLQVTAKLKKGNSLVYEKKYVINHSQPFVNSSIVNTNKLRSDFTTNMVEGLSFSTKECIEQIVADLNLSFYGSVPSVMQENNEPRIQNPAEIAQDSVKAVQPLLNEQNTSLKVESKKDQLKAGDQVMFFSFTTNSNIKGVVKEIKGETILIEYVTFGKLKTIEISKYDVRKTRPS